jgi:hypothetical protein
MEDPEVMRVYLGVGSPAERGTAASPHVPGGAA